MAVRKQEKICPEISNGKSYLCSIDIGGEDWNFVWLTRVELDEVQKLCSGTGISVYTAENK